MVLSGSSLFSYRFWNDCAKFRILNIPLGEVHIGLLTDQIGVTATDTLNLSQCVHDLLPAVHIGVQKTQDELEVRLLPGHERWRNKSVATRLSRKG